jgi:hypothetical protein
MTDRELIKEVSEQIGYLIDKKQKKQPLKLLFSLSDNN